MPAEFELSEDQALDAIRGLVKDTVNQGNIGVEKLTQWIWATEQQIVNLVDTLQSSIEACKRLEDLAGPAIQESVSKLKIDTAIKAERPIFGGGVREHAIPGGRAVEQMIPFPTPQEDDGEIS